MVKDGLCSSALGWSTGGSWVLFVFLAPLLTPRARPLSALSIDRSLPRAAWACGEQDERDRERERIWGRKQEREREWEGRGRRQSTFGAMCLIVDSMCMWEPEKRFICFVSSWWGESFPQHTHLHNKCRLLCTNAPTKWRWAHTYSDSVSHTHNLNCTGKDHMLIITPAEPAAAVYSYVHLTMWLQTFIIRTHYTHMESFAMWFPH